MARNSWPYCAEQAKLYDRDRFRISLFEPPALRPPIWALLAFNAEIAKTREVVTETQIGHIRLQWWRDRLAEIYEGKPGGWQKNEILSALAEGIENFGLSRAEFENLTYAREFDLEDVPPSSMEGLVKYADYTTSPLLRLITCVEGVSESEAVVRDLGVSYALTGLLRAVPLHAAQKRLYLPSEEMEARAVSVGALFRFEPDPRLKDLVRDIHEKAARHLQETKPESRFLSLSALTAGFYLKKIKKAGFDVFSKKLAGPDPFLPLRLWFKGM